MTVRLEGKKALVAGGGRGIGRAIALGLAREGADVAIPYLRGTAEAEDAVDTIRSMGRNAFALRADIGSRSEVEALVTEIASRFGQIHVLVNAAGQLRRRGFLEMSDEEFDETLAVYLKGPFMTGQAVARYMVTQGRGGSIINFTSILAERAVVNLSHYQSAKGAVAMLTKSMALELAPHGIRVNAISPGLTETDANRDQREGQPDVWSRRVALIPAGRAGKPDDHVGAAVFLASDESAWVTGTILTVDGGQTAT